MFIRKKSNKSGSVSVQIIDKSDGYKVIKTIGSSKDKFEIEKFIRIAESWIQNNNPNQQKLFSLKAKEELVIENFAKNLTNAQIHTIGPELIFGTLFDRIGFNQIKNDLFRHITIARLSFPTSKLKTVDYLNRYQGIKTEISSVYRFLDKLSDKYKEKVERIAFDYTKRILKNISVVFYDMTTLYFEAEDEDDLRKIGFSKDGKFQKPQIMIGLLVGQNGYPIAYDIFRGNTFEGHTLMPFLEKIQKKYNFKKPIVIADSALLSKKNLKEISKQEYAFIIGARIKNESKEIKDEILEKSKNPKKGNTFVIKRPDQTRLIVHFSEKRRKKDEYNRKKGLKKLEQKIRYGRLTKNSINNRGYNKFLKLKGKIEVKLDKEKIKQDEKWDGLKGYVTNTELEGKEVIDNYKHLWQIEKAFRISKTDLRVRPIYHYRENRIKAHICISFVAYTIYKELERLLDKHKVKMSPKRAAELTHNMYEIEYFVYSESKNQKIILKMDEEQKKLYKMFYKNY